MWPPKFLWNFGVIARPTPFELKTEFSVLNSVDKFLNDMFHPQVPLGMPCYDFTLVINLTLIPRKWYFGYYWLPWCDGRWVQGSGTYSPRRSWSAITSDSTFMRSSCRPQSELRPVLMGLAPPRGFASPLYRPLYHVCSPGHKGHADLASSPPSSPPSKLYAISNRTNKAFSNLYC